jgi:hypothetical protein
MRVDPPGRLKDSDWGLVLLEHHRSGTTETLQGHLRIEKESCKIIWRMNFDRAKRRASLRFTHSSGAHIAIVAVCGSFKDAPSFENGPCVSPVEQYH